MRFIFWILWLIVAIIVMAFAVSNRQPVLIGLWPFEQGLSVPAYLAILVPLIIGLLLGWAGTTLANIGVRFRARQHARRADRLERDLAELRVRALPTKTELPVLSSDLLPPI